MSNPKRIVSLVPSHTESLHALGLESEVVGRTRFCIHPAPWVDSIPHVGGTKDASVDKILALEPDLVVADKDENPLALVKELQAAGVDVLWSEIDTVQDAAKFLRVLGERCGKERAGAELADQIGAELEKSSQESPLPVFCPIWYEPWMTFNGTAYPSAMLDAAGFENAFAAQAGPKYFEVTTEDVAQSAAKLTLLPTEPFPFHKRLQDVVTSRLGAAGDEESVHVIDGEALTWFGVRTISGLRDLAKFRQSLSS